LTKKAIIKAKPPSKAELWKKLLKAVDAAAAELGVHPESFKLAKKRVPTGARHKSDAWKYHERNVRDEANDVGFSATRISRGADLGVSDIDVEIDGLPFLKIDCKYKVDGWVHHTIFEDTEELYCKEPGTWLALPTKVGGAEGSLTTIRTEVFFDLLARACGIKERMEYIPPALSLKLADDETVDAEEVVLEELQPKKRKKAA
jgi:hypothetical protein